METNTDILIAGGGLAGLASGIHLAKNGLSVIIIEKENYPRHKVCGEYVSNEILPYLKWLGAEIETLDPKNIDILEFSTPDGKKTVTHLPLGGKGISRYALDNHLYKIAIQQGCTVIHDTVNSITYNENTFNVKTIRSSYTAKVVLGAYGKRSGIDQTLNRNFFTKKSPWLAVKAHYKGTFEDNTVGLHNFPGGYCGISKTETGAINICYLADYATFKQYKNIDDYQTGVLYKNIHLKKILTNSTPLFEKPLAISQISFDKKATVENHILMIGDTAGLIHPLCGNGMAMAIHSAQIASELAIDFLKGHITRNQMEKKYCKAWKTNFSNRMAAGRLITKILRNPYFSRQALKLITMFPSLLNMIIKQTHGKPLNATYNGN